MKGYADLIWGVGFRSGGSGLTQATAAAELAGLSFPAAALLDSSLDFVEFDVSRVISTKVWVRGARCGMLNPPEHSYGLRGALRRGLHGRRASACRGSPACTFACVSRHESGGQRSCAHRQGTGKVERGSGEVVLRCRGVAMVERRRCQPTARNPRTRRGRRKGKWGTAWSLPPREAVAVQRSRESAV